VNASLISGLDRPFGIAISGDDLFVVNRGDAPGTGTIGEYTTSGAVVNASLISGLNLPYGLAVYGDDLFVANQFNGTIGEYTTSGATIDASLISGLHEPVDIAIGSAPEPSGVALIGLGVAGLWFWRRVERESVRA
jgi:hypothetical protein